MNQRRKLIYIIDPAEVDNYNIHVSLNNSDEVEDKHDNYENNITAVKITLEITIHLSTSDKKYYIRKSVSRVAIKYLLKLYNTDNLDYI